MERISIQKILNSIVLYPMRTAMEEFIKDFADTRPELAKDLMVMVENEIVKEVERHIEWWGEKERGRFNEEQKAEIIAKIKKAIRREIVIDLNDYGM